MEYTVIDFNSTVAVVVDTAEEDDDGFAVSNTLVLAGLLGLIIMILLLLIVLRAMRSEPVNTDEQLPMNTVDVVEEELGVDLSPSGLLSRINNGK